MNKDPGPLSLCHWILGGLPSNKFLKKSLLEAFLSVNDYDILILGETHLTSSTNVEDLVIDGYDFKRCDHPNNEARGGIMVYYKQCLPCTFKPEIAQLRECLVFQIKIGSKKCFFTCLYRNPSQENNQKENVDLFANLLRSTLDNINGKNPYVNVLVGDMNAKNSVWWGNQTDYPGDIIHDVSTHHNFYQLIDHPTHFYPGKKASCIDLFFCSRPRLISQVGTLPSLLSQCHHGIIFAKIDLQTKSPPPYTRRMWDYKNADITNIRRAISEVNWERTFRPKNVNDQVEFLTNSINHVFTNFCPNRTIKCRAKDAPWMTNEIKIKLKEKKKLYKKFIQNTNDLGYKYLLETKMLETSDLILKTKEDYYSKEGLKLTDPSLGPKRYWSILNSFLGKRKLPLIPPIQDEDNIITDYRKKADIFNDYFSSQCTPLDENNEVPHINPKTHLNMKSINIDENKILSIIRGLNPHKSSGWDNISSQMIKICDASLVSPLKIIFENAMNSGNFPDKWKMSNVCPIHKKNSRNLKENYRPISLLPILGKIFEKILFDALYHYFIVEN